MRITDGSSGGSYHSLWEGLGGDTRDNLEPEL